MRAQILLIALLVWGPVGSALCRASCDHTSAAVQLAAEQPSSTPASGASHCHGGEPDPASSSQDSDGSDSVCSCADFDRTRTLVPPAPRQDSVAFAPAALLGLRGVQIARSDAPRVRTPGQASSPYLFQNPPLLI